MNARKPPSVQAQPDSEGKWLVELLRAALRQRNEDNQAARAAEGKALRTSVYASELGEACDRKMHFRLTDTPPSDPIGDDSLMNFFVGSSIEDAFSVLLSQIPGMKLHQQVRGDILTASTKVAGKIDFLLEATDPTQLEAWLAERGVIIDIPARSLIECKSTTSFSAKMMYEKNEKGQESHRYQALAYVHASRIGALTVEGSDEPLPPFDSALLLYVVKDAKKGSAPIHAFPVNYSEIHAEAALRRAEDRWRKAKGGAPLPPIPQGYEWKKFPCAWCDHRATCWSGRAESGTA